MYMNIEGECVQSHDLNEHDFKVRKIACNITHAFDAHNLYEMVCDDRHFLHGKCISFKPIICVCQSGRLSIINVFIPFV